MNIEIQVGSIVSFNKKVAILKEILDSGQTATPKALIIQEGQEYSVNINDIKPYEEVK